MMVLSRIAPTLSSPLPAGESVGRLRRPFLLKNAEAKLRLWRIVRCAAGEGTFRESELHGETPHPKPALRSGFDLSPPGRGKKARRMAMHRLLLTMTTLLLGANGCLAQVSTMGTTAMGLPSTPGAIVTSPLYGPSPFSATTQPGANDTTLAAVPLASDPTTPGTVVTCSTPTGQITPGTPAVPVTSVAATAGVAATMPSISAAPTSVALAASSTPGSTATPYLTLSAQPATSS